MENITPDIEKLLNEKLSSYQQINLILKEERDYIVNIDVDSLWKTSEKKKELARTIEETKKNLISCLNDQFYIHDMNIKSFSLTYFIRVAPIQETDKIKLRKIKISIDNEKKEIAQVAFDNKKYVQEYLSVIDEIMSVAVDRSSEVQYSHSGRISKAKHINRLIQAQV